MPGFDGTGPRGRGPMTGGGRGFCVLRVPSKPDESVTGFAGLSGRPVSGCRLRPAMELASLRARAERLQAVLGAMRDRIGPARQARKRRKEAHSHPKEPEVRGS